MSGGLARASVFGVSDGLVSNMALILGFAGSGVDNGVVRLAGLAGAVAGAISMGAGEWVSVTSQNDLIKREVEVERREIELNPRHETEELSQAFQQQGMTPDHAAEAAADIMSEPEIALSVHTRRELGVNTDLLPSAVRAAVLSVVCFLSGAVIPLVPWFVGTGSGAAWASLLLGTATAIIVGGIVARFADRPIWFGSLRQVTIVLVACSITYAIGELANVNLS